MNVFVCVVALFVYGCMCMVVCAWLYVLGLDYGGDVWVGQGIQKIFGG